MQRATMERLIREYLANGGPDLPLYVSSLLEQERTLLARLAGIRRLQKEEQDGHDAAMRKLSKQLEELQEECHHHERSYQGDPSGGSDRCEWCELCQREF